MATFAPLKGESKGGKTMVWSIKVEEDADGHGVIIVTRGYEGGVMQTDVKVIEEGKNIGKKNETSPLEQAILEARSTWNKKEAAGYVEVEAKGAAATSASASAAAISSDKSTAITTTIPMPMLANKYEEKKKYVKFPCFVQPKFDGTRTIAVCGIPEGKPCLFSRQRKAYPHLEHIEKVIRLLPKGLILDGELFTTEFDFQSIVGLVKKKTLTPEELLLHNKIQLHLYDVIDTEEDFETRYAMLEQVFERYGDLFDDVLQLCPTEEIEKAEDLEAKHDEYVDLGYEGLMIRNKDGMYLTGPRSNDLLKMKKFSDDEFEIVGFKDGEGREEGCVIWQCKTKEGATFHCRPEGTLEEKKELFKHGADYIGKFLTVRYQELTNDGIPRFPIGVAIRDYE
jgi:ATP-dependent DNA ligase